MHNNISSCPPNSFFAPKNSLASPPPLKKRGWLCFCVQLVDTERKAIRWLKIALLLGAVWRGNLWGNRWEFHSFCRLVTRCNSSGCQMCVVDPAGCVRLLLLMPTIRLWFLVYTDMLSYKCVIYTASLFVDVRWGGWRNDSGAGELFIQSCLGLGLHLWRRGVVVSGFGLINEVNWHWARLVLGWVTVSGRVNHLGM